MDEQFCELCEFQMVCEMSEELPELCPYRRISEEEMESRLEKTELEELIETSEDDF